jgi:hypothetical protein
MGRHRSRAASRRIDLETPTFSNPTKITSALDLELRHRSGGSVPGGVPAEE